MTVETQIKQLQAEFKKEINQLKQIICTRMLATKWVDKDLACILLKVKPRQLANIRVHSDKSGKKVGCIGWRKGAGKNVQYYLPDIEKYNNQFVIMN